MSALFAPEASGGPRVLLPDLVVDSVSQVLDSPREGMLIVLIVRIKNVGRVASAASSVRIDVQGAPTLFQIPALEPGAEANIMRRWRLGPGKTEVQVRADAGNAVPECDEGNNTKSLTIEAAAPKPDLVLAGFAGLPLSTGPTGSVRLTATIVNAGPGASPPASVVLRAGNEAAPPALPVAALQPGASVTVDRTVVVEDSKFLATATLDPAGVVAETNESNNTSQGLFWSRSIADLAFQMVRTMPTAPMEGGHTVVYATVTNQGSVASVPCTATFKLSSEASTPSIAVPAVAPGATASVSRILHGLSAGTYLVKGQLDTTNAVAELDEANNVIELNVVVNPRPTQ